MELKKALQIVCTGIILLIITAIPAACAHDDISRVAQGDPFIISGSATGNTDNGIAVWILGTNYYSYNNVQVIDNEYSFELKPAETQSLAGGEYYAIIQLPGSDGNFHVKPVENSPSEGQTSVVSSPDGSSFIISGPGMISSPSGAAEALLDMINSPLVEDSAREISFIIESPYITINTIGNHYIGDAFAINGTTNLAPGNKLIVNVRPSGYDSSQKDDGSKADGISGTALIIKDTPANKWSLDIDTYGFETGEYLVSVQGELVSGDATDATFNMLKTPPTTIATAAPVTPAPTEPVTTTEPTKSGLNPLTATFTLLIAGFACTISGMRKKN